MTGYVADANLLISLLDPDNAMHDAAVEALADVPDDEPIAVHPINAAEVLSFFTHAVVREQRWNALCTAHPFLVAPEPPGATPLATAMRLADIRHITGKKMPDVCAMHLALTRSATLITHDKRLGKSARGLGIQTLPPAAPQHRQSAPVEAASISSREDNAEEIDRFADNHRHADDSDRQDPP